MRNCGLPYHRASISSISYAVETYKPDADVTWLFLSCSRPDEECCSEMTKQRKIWSKGMKLHNIWHMT